MKSLLLLAVVIGAAVQQEPLKYDVPKLRGGAHKPALEEKLDEKWARYRFPEIPATVELPAEPKPAEKNPMMSQPNSLVGEYTDYSLKTWWGSYNFAVLWMKRDWTVKDFGDVIKFGYAMMPNVLDNKINTVSRKIGSLEGYEVICRLKIKPPPGEKDPRPFVIRIFIWRKDGLCCSFETQYDGGDEKPALKEYERVIASYKKAA